MSDDPTRIRNQPALTTASGSSWLIIAGLFSGISIAVLIALSTLPPQWLAIATIAVIISLYVAMIVVKLAVKPRPHRLRIMALFFLAIAFVGLGSVIAIAAVNWAAV